MCQYEKNETNPIVQESSADEVRLQGSYKALVINGQRLMMFTILRDGKQINIPVTLGEQLK